MADSRTGEGKYESGISYNAKKEGSLKKDKIKVMEACQKDTGANLKELPMSKAEKNFSKKILMALDYNPKNKINIHESIMIQKLFNK